MRFAPLVSSVQRVNTTFVDARMASYCLCSVQAANSAARHARSDVQLCTDPLSGTSLQLFGVNCWAHGFSLHACACLFFSESLWARSTHSMGCLLLQGQLAGI